MSDITTHTRTYDYPVRILQFGEGNFLRAFWDKAVHELNASGVFRGQICIVQPIEHGRLADLARQNYLYTVCLQSADSQEVTLVESVKDGVNPYTDVTAFTELAADPNIRIVISNTTEAGIVYDENDSFFFQPPESFPGKLLAFLHQRYHALGGAPGTGLLIFPSELIENNGDALRAVLLKLAETWKLSSDFIRWFETENVFFSTLVDCIVTGYPVDEADAYEQQLGYRDDLLVKGENYQFLAISGDQQFRDEFPIEKASLNVVWCDDLSRYREIKVRIMNGYQTMLAQCGFLAGLETEREAVNHPQFGPFMKDVLYREIVPSLPYGEAEKQDFAETMLRRLDNPHIRHMLSDINLNSFSKFQTRLIPSMNFWFRQGEQPTRLLFACAAALLFYRAAGDKKTGYRASCCGREYQVFDTPGNLETLRRINEESRQQGESTEGYCRRVLQESSLWMISPELGEQDITKLAELMRAIEDKGILAAAASLA